MNWALKTSDYWPNKIKDSRSFKNAHGTIREQWLKYKSAVQASAETEDETHDPDEVTDARAL